MVQPAQVKSYIEEGLPCELVRVDGDGHHFEAVIVSAAFRGKNKVTTTPARVPRARRPHARRNTRAVHADVHARELGEKISAVIAGG